MVAPLDHSHPADRSESRTDDTSQRVRIAATMVCALAVADMVAEWLLRDRGVLRQLIGAGSRGLVPLAAVLFFISDVYLAQTAFFGGGVTWISCGYPLYYNACLLLAWSVNEQPPLSAPR